MVGSLSTSISASATALSCVSMTGSYGATTAFVAFTTGTKQYRIRIDREIMLVTGASTISGGFSLTVTRGIEGTTAAPHASASVIAFILTAGALNSRMADECGRGLIANRPDVSVANNRLLSRLYHAEDGDSFYLDNNDGTWWKLGPIFGLSLPAAGTTWSTYNLTNPQATLSETNGIWTFSSPGASSTGDNLAIATLSGLPPADPSGNWALEIGIMPSWEPKTGEAQCGVCWMDTVSGKIQIFGWSALNAYPTLFGQRFSNYTTIGAADLAPIQINWAQCRFLRLTYNVTLSTMIASVSPDRYNWQTAYSLTINTYLTPNKVGIFLNPYTSSRPISMTVFHYLPRAGAS